jgi:hypothetical protein
LSHQKSASTTGNFISRKREGGGGRNSACGQAVKQAGLFRVRLGLREIEGLDEEKEIKRDRET